jgi:hypothetical protein
LPTRQETSEEKAVSPGETPLSTYFKTAQAGGKEFRLGVGGQSSRGAAERRCEPVHTGLEFVDEIVPLRSRAGAGSLGAGGVKFLCVVHSSLRMTVHVQDLAFWASSRTQGVEGESSRGAETQERIGHRRGATRVGANGLAGGSRLRSGCRWRNGRVPSLEPGVTRKRASVRGKGAHSRRGNQATACERGRRGNRR